MTRKNHAGRLPLLSHIVVWLYGLILVVPLYFVLISSFKSNTEIFNSPFSAPDSFGLGNFVKAWERVDLDQALVNSALVTGISLVLTLFLAIPASYAIARFRGKAGVYVERFFALGLLIPSFAAMVPTVFLAIWMGLFQTREFLYLFFPATALPLAVILLTQFMRAIPSELEESATMDGAGRIRILVSIYTPLVIPGIATVTILNFLSFWNEYLFSLILAGPSPSERTSQVALPILISQTETEFGVLLAGAVITMIPVYLVYIILNRRLEDVLVRGAVKG